MDILHFRGYEGTAELDMTRQVCRGKILFIGDLVTYEAKTPDKLQEEFEEAVKDYEGTCLMLGREPKISLKGQFNVRVSPALHEKAVLRALTEGVRLNEIMTRALDAYLNSPSQPIVNNSFQITVDSQDQTWKVLSSASATTQREVSRANH